MTAPVLNSESPWWTNITNQTNPDQKQTCDSSENFKYLAYTITYSVVFPIGLISNVVALFVFFRLTNKKTANTVFMINLAISDVGFSLTLPLRLVYYFRGCHWDFSDWLCRWCVFSFYVNLYTSVLFLTGLSVLRYIAVLHPLKVVYLVSVRKASVACLAIWIFVSCLSSPFLMSGTILRQNKLRCFDPGNDTSWNRIFTLNYVGVSFGFVIPFITILVCYSCIIHKLATKGKDLKMNKREHRTVYLIVVVLSTFLLCFLPYHVVRTVHLHAVVSKKPCPLVEMWLKVLVVSLCTAASNSCFNPLLYYFAGENFRTSIGRVSKFRRVNSSTRSRRGTRNSSINNNSQKQQSYKGARQAYRDHADPSGLAENKE
ncbi:cysteinyl leukotriene receptor 2 [Triplophysa dalaica]|uniref:cysteinyl leukotriene receptor 2 n=1 Tax=Triplophysa dalaica TaxID=1582913 RepID=UPI0024DFC6DF|nr:cysteinyl leukotriene receptor 2 [Triplophysa dalaica]